MAVMTLLKRIPMSREEYDNLPEGPPYYDYVDGEAIEVNRASVRHNDVTACLYVALKAYVRTSATGKLATDVSLELPSGTIFGPDILYFSADNPECRIRQRGDVEGVPDLVVEVLSPSTEDYDRGEKMVRYHRAGVKWLWLISQDSLLSEEFQWSESGYMWILPGEDRVFRPRLFPGLELNLAELVDEDAVTE